MTQTSARLLDGQAVAAAIRESVLPDVHAFPPAPAAPGLGIVLVGDDPASEIYVRNKVRAAPSPASAST
jgi:methylenetetrahydrofolate dehydrogenase (NADP+) / methenyltetrahydrofolate cyclohydrolase